MMKKSSLLMIAVALILSSCGMASKYTSTTSEGRFQDGIYNNAPSFRTKAEKDESRSKAASLMEETKASQIYLFGEKKDSIIIPENMSASIRYDKSLASTVVTVGENPYAWQNNIDPWYYYTPYSIGSSWYWSRHYDPWYSNPWHWNTWTYSPWRYYGWYDPWYYGGFYDPWYYGGYYGGYYGYMYPHYYGWYGGWDPYWGHHHHHHAAPIDNKDRWNGSRRQTGSERVFTSRESTRGGSTSTSRVSRATSVANHRRPAGSAATSTSTSGTASRVSTGSPSRASYRATTNSSRETNSSNTSRSYNNSSSSSYRNSSSTPATRTTSYNSGGASRSFGGGSTGGGATRSGGSSGRRR